MNGIAAINAVIIIVNIQITMMIVLIGRKEQKGIRMRLIDADELKDYLIEGTKENRHLIPPSMKAVVDTALSGFIQDIDEQPTVEADLRDTAEVFTGEHAEEYYGLEAICGSCGTAWEGTGGDNFCPNCGIRLIDKGRCINEKDTNTFY